MAELLLSVFLIAYACIFFLVMLASTLAGGDKAADAFIGHGLEFLIAIAGTVFGGWWAFFVSIYCAIAQYIMCIANIKNRRTGSALINIALLILFVVGVFQFFKTEEQSPASDTVKI